MIRALCFLPGHHGNYLARLVDISSGLIPDFNIFSESGTAHINKEIPNKIFRRVCIGELPWEDDRLDFTWENDIVSNGVSINWQEHNAFETVYFFYKTVRDRNIDLLNDSNLSKGFLLCPSQREYRNLLVYPKYFNTLDKSTNEMYMDWLIKQFHVAKQLTRYQPKFAFSFDFNWFYEDEKSFVNNLMRLLDFCNLKYKVDITHHHTNFLKNKVKMLDAKLSKGSIFQSAYQHFLNENIDIDINMLGPRYKSYFQKNN